MFGDQPEAADLGRNCEIRRVELETDLPWCQFCIKGESSLWEGIEQLKIGSGEKTVVSMLTGWSQQLPGWNLQQGLEMLLKPSNRRLPRTTQPKRAPFVVVEGIDSSGKTTHVEAVANALAHLHYSVRVITFPNNLTPLGRFLKHILQTGSQMECWTQHILFSLHRWEVVDLIQESLITGTAVICERYAWSGVVCSYVSDPRMPLRAYMTCDHGILQPDVVVLLTSKAEVPVEKLFTDADRSNIILFLGKCVTVIDPRVRKAVSHYGHVPAMYAAGDGTNHCPGTDALWSDKGNAMYEWMCNQMGYVSDTPFNAESKGRLVGGVFQPSLHARGPWYRFDTVVSG